MKAIKSKEILRDIYVCVCACVYSCLQLCMHVHMCVLLSEKQM